MIGDMYFSLMSHDFVYGLQIIVYPCIVDLVSGFHNSTCCQFRW
ncbi:hypothetical protein BDFB_010800 [Asbolus verrucosus]|uniref:Uncharacterized protein n=1 Tax=Asbolus verrucosus TaxID=1661398 RepID=A0A482W618_ASBVE|nr:hypothetical protein BDFB_010800 [Asbolus verrucosus]